ncbi:MAG: DUF4388 domain-containing protein [bacterium]|nr:DUF4388 domain-containing protein [bacterium]
MDLTANLEIFSGAELISLISQGKKTGVLYFDVSGEKGELCFIEGAPVHASFKSLFGEEALYNIMIEKQGTVSYKDKIAVKDRTIQNNSASELLSQIEKRKVEFDDLAKKLPPFDAILEKRADGLGENISLRKSDWAVIRIVDGKKNIKTIIKDSKLPLFEVYKTLEYLLSKGMVFDRSQSEKMKSELLSSMNNIVEAFSIKGANTKDWALSIIDMVMSNGYETIGGMLKYSGEKFSADDAVLKVLDDEKVAKLKELLYKASLEKATGDLGPMIAKKKYKELMQKEGVSDGTF